MIRKITLFFVALLCTYFTSFSQKCGFDQVHGYHMANDPAYARSFNDMKARWAAYVASTPNISSLKVLMPNGVDTVYEIPVVVHVIDTSAAFAGRYSPSNAIIQAWIDQTNKAWAAESPYTLPGSGGTRIPIKFVLAKRDTACNASNGIIRKNGSVLASYNAGGIETPGGGFTGGETDATIKGLSRWNNTLYYNIYIVNKIDGVNGYTGSGSFTAGYAYPPVSPIQYSVDGAVVLASQVFDYANNVTLAHEVGHAFGLQHTFEGDVNGTTCPPNLDCTLDGDGICDTDPHIRSPFTCPTGTNPCTGNAYGTVVHNFMDYSNCQDRFTPGQRAKMMFNLKSHLSRSGFLTSLGATAPPATSLVSSCTTSINPANASTAISFNNGPRKIVIADPASMTVKDTFFHVESGGYSDGGAYVNNTCKHRVTLTAGRTYSITVTVTAGNNKAKAYIDYNNNGIFENTERILNASTGFSSTKQANFVVPTSASTVMCTPLRMRVIADVATNVDSCDELQYGQAEDYTVVIRGSGGSATGSVTLSKPPIGGNPSCPGAELTYYAVPSSGLTITAIKWFKNGILQPTVTTDTFRSTAFNNNDSVKVRILYISPCGIDSVTSVSDTVRRSSSIGPAVTMALTGGVLPGCIEDTLTFSVTGTINPGGAPVFSWQRNTGSGYAAIPSSNAIISPDGRTLRTWGNPAGTLIRAQMLSNSSCAPTPNPAVSSNDVTITYTTQAPTVSIALTTGNNPGCAGQLLTFTATPTTGGIAPVYEWRVNNVTQTGITGPTFTATLANGDVVKAILTSNSTCASTPTATSNDITIVHQQITADVSIAQTTPSPSCDSQAAVFTATTTNPGTSPLYQWRINGTNVGAPQGPVFTNVVENNDVVDCIFMSSDPCVLNQSDTSNALTVATTPSARPTINVKITQGKDPGCLDSLVEFTATVTSIGSSPQLDWFVNGFNVASGPTYSSTSLVTNDVVYCRAHQTDGQCYLPDTVYSIPDTMMRSLTLDPPIIHLIGNMLTVDRKGTFIWFGPGGQLTDGRNGQLYPQTLGAYYAITDNNGCWSGPSNVLVITLLDVDMVNMQDVKIYPNPSSGKLTFDWAGKTVNMNIGIYNQLGQQVMKTNATDVSTKVIIMEGLANGVYYIVLTDEQGHSGTVKVQLQK